MTESETILTKMTNDYFDYIRRRLHVPPLSVAINLKFFLLFAQCVVILPAKMENTSYNIIAKQNVQDKDMWRATACRCRQCSDAGRMGTEDA